jgi:pimeloyl-ACP methyl ester carboxylesterase
MRAGASRSFTVGLADGRTLEIVAEGPMDALPLVFQSGTPCAAVLFPSLVAAAANRGLRTVAYSRPGYANSTPKPGRSVADCAADIDALLDALHAHTFVTVGWSGGGPHALACAALLPGRCAAAASIGSVAPFGIEGFDWFAGMASNNVKEFSLAAEGEAALTPALEKWAKGLAQMGSASLATSLGGLVTDVDRAALTGRFADFVAASFHGGVTSGIAGWRDDDLAFIRDWGFSLADITRPVALWHGDQDVLVPFAHGEWLATHIPHARANLRSGEGHLSLVGGGISEIIDDLLDLASLQSNG